MDRKRTRIRPNIDLDGPVRTCVGCRRKAPQRDLLRVVLVDGQVLPDPRRERLGRGAYTHADEACVHAAIARKAFARALRARGPVDTSAVVRIWGMSEPKVGSVGMTTR